MNPDERAKAVEAAKRISSGSLMESEDFDLDANLVASAFLSLAQPSDADVETDETERELVASTIKWLRRSSDHYRASGNMMDAATTLGVKRLIERLARRCALGAKEPGEKQ